jgi:hypothetical protein
MLRLFFVLMRQGVGGNNGTFELTTLAMAGGTRKLLLLVAGLPKGARLLEDLLRCRAAIG